MVCNFLTYMYRSRRRDTGNWQSLMKYTRFTSTHRLFKFLLLTDQEICLLTYFAYVSDDVLMKIFMQVIIAFRVLWFSTSHPLRQVKPALNLWSLITLPRTLNNCIFGGSTTWIMDWSHITTITFLLSQFHGLCLFFQAVRQQPP